MCVCLHISLFFFLSFFFLVSIHFAKLTKGRQIKSNNNNNNSNNKSRQLDSSSSLSLSLSPCLKTLAEAF